MMKICTKCGDKKPLDRFGSRSKKKQHILKSHCKECLYRATLEWRNNNKERFNEYQRQYKRNHK